VKNPAAKSAMAAIENLPPVQARSKSDDEDDDECECKCDACGSGQHAQCSNEECADPNCDHEPRSKAQSEAAALKSLEERWRIASLQH